VEFTDDELTIIIEALKEYHLRTDGVRRALCETLGYRFAQGFITNLKHRTQGNGQQSDGATTTD